MLLRSGWTPSRRCGKYCSDKVRVLLRPSHRQSRGRRGGGRPEGLGTQHLLALSRTSQQPAAPAARSRQRFAQHPKATQAPLLGLVCHPVAKTQLQHSLSLPTLPLSSGKEGTMLGCSLGSISPWRSRCGSCRQQWGALSLHCHPAGEAYQRYSWQGLL